MPAVDKTDWIWIKIPNTRERIHVPPDYKFEPTIIDLVSEDEGGGEVPESESDGDSKPDLSVARSPSPRVPQDVAPPDIFKSTPAWIKSYLFTHPLNPETLKLYVPDVYKSDQPREIDRAIATNIAHFYVKGVTSQADFERMLEYLLVHPEEYKQPYNPRGYWYEWDDRLYQRVWKKVEELRKTSAVKENDSGESGPKNKKENGRGESP